MEKLSFEEFRIKIRENLIAYLEVSKKEDLERVDEALEDYSMFVEDGYKEYLNGETIEKSIDGSLFSSIEFDYF